MVVVAATSSTIKKIYKNISSEMKLKVVLNVVCAKKIKILTETLFSNS